MLRITNLKLGSEVKHHRLCFKELKSYVESDICYSGRVCILYELRRTGKTVLLKQLCQEEPNSILYVCSAKDTMDGIYKVLDEHLDDGTKLVCLDEITEVEDFIYDCSELADVYASQGIRIVLSGTNSFGFRIALNDELLDRADIIRTSYISFAEHSKVLGTRNIDEYIQYGGLMHKNKSFFDEDEGNLKTYLDSAVTGNLVTSLKNAGEWKPVSKIGEEQLCKIINKIVEFYSGSLNLRKLKQSQKSSVITFPLKVKAIQDSLDSLQLKAILKNRSEIIRDFSKIIDTDFDAQTKEALTDDILYSLIVNLFKMNVVSKVEVNEYNRSEEIPERELRTAYDETYIIQPAIKYHQLVEAQSFYLKSAEFKALNSKEASLLATKLQEKIFSDMLEQIILYEVKQDWGSDWKVCKPCFKSSNAGEYDMLMWNRGTDEYLSFKIKHSSKEDAGQRKHLLNERFDSICERNYGKCKGKYVLYYGKSGLIKDGVTYLNASDFLIAFNDLASPYDVIEKCLEVSKNECDQTDFFDK